MLPTNYFLAITVDSYLKKKKKKASLNVYFPNSISVRSNVMGTFSYFIVQKFECRSTI